MSYANEYELTDEEVDMLLDELYRSDNINPHMTKEKDNITTPGAINPKVFRRILVEGKDYIVEPNTGRWLDPKTLIPIDNLADFSNIDLRNV